MRWLGSYLTQSFPKGEQDVHLRDLLLTVESARCSPSQWAGPARYLDPPCGVADLPPIQICCISHDHCTFFVSLAVNGSDSRAQMTIWITTPSWTSGASTMNAYTSSLLLVGFA